MCSNTPPIARKTSSRVAANLNSMAAFQVTHAAIRLEVADDARNGDSLLILGKEVSEVIMHHVPNVLFIFRPHLPLVKLVRRLFEHRFKHRQLVGMTWREPIADQAPEAVDEPLDVLERRRALSSSRSKSLS